MENYTRVIGATSTNIRTPTTGEINQGNDALTPFDSAKNNGYINEVSEQVKDISAELINLITEAGLTPDETLTQVKEAIDLIIGDNIADATTTTKGVSLLPKQITIANNADDSEHDLDFPAGNAQAINGSGVYRVGALTKRIDETWVAGNDAGALDTGTVANNTPYYIYTIENLTTGAGDILYTASVPTVGSKAYSGANMPSGWGNESYIGACHTDGSANIRQGIWRYGEKEYRFEYNIGSAIVDVSVTSITSANRTFYSLSCPAGSRAIFSFVIDTTKANNGQKLIYLTNNLQADSNAVANIIWVQGAIENVNYSQYYEKQLGSNNQIGIRGSATDPDISINTIGWTEYL
jgi:hypothetical protein